MMETHVVVVMGHRPFLDAICTALEEDGFATAPVPDLPAAFAMDDAFELDDSSASPDVRAGHGGAASLTPPSAPPADDLSGLEVVAHRLVHVCSWCGRIRRSDGTWVAPGDYTYPGRPRGRLGWNPGRLVYNTTHGICDPCAAAVSGARPGAVVSEAGEGA